VVNSKGCDPSSVLSIPTHAELTQVKNNNIFAKIGYTSCADLEVRHNNMEESVLYYIRNQHNHSILPLGDFAVPLDPSMYIGSLQVNK